MKTRDEVIGRTCKTCGAPADVVATWQRPPSKGHPLGSLEHVPYCAVHALADMNGPTPPPDRSRTTRTRCSAARPSSATSDVAGVPSWRATRAGSANGEDMSS